MDNISLLIPAHQTMLEHESGIASHVIAARQYRTISRQSDLERLGFARSQRSVPSLLIPLWGVGGGVALYHHRPDTPRRTDNGKPIKYEFPRGGTMALDVHPSISDRVRNPKTPLYITEGVKKADAAISRGLCCVGVIGVWNFRGKNEHGGLTALPDWEGIALKGRDENGNVYGRKVYIVYDSDVMLKESVYAALRRLSAFLQQRGADVCYIYLPTGEGGAKIGLDDYFVAGHTVDDLMRRASAALIEPPAEQREEKEPPYTDAGGGLVWNRRTIDGITPVTLTNFTSRIVSDTIEDDGAEERRKFTIEATLSGRKRQFDVPAEQFAAMNWHTHHLGARAIMFPGQSIREHARTAIQTLSNAGERHVRTHLGWIQTASGQWLYCHGGGVFGGDSEGVEVRVQDQLGKFVLPAPPPADDVSDAINATLRFWRLGKSEVVFPVAAAALRAVLGASDFSLFLSGPTGVFKSELAALAQQHFGPTMTARNLPADWSATDNYLEGLAFAAKDALFVIDEFVPRGGVHDREKHHGKADRVLRAQGNNAARGRMRADGTLRPAKPPRGLILSTGEDIPQGQSLRARMFVIEVSPGDIPTDALSLCQQDAAAGKYAATMAAYLTWLAPRYEKIRCEFRQEIERFRNHGKEGGAHRRLPEITANLKVGIVYFLRFATSAGAMSEAQAKEWFDWCQPILSRAAEAQGRLQDDNEPTRRFTELLAGAIGSGRAHIAGMNGAEPTDPERWGWRSCIVGSGDYIREDWRPHGDRIGFVDGDNLYLLPDVAYQVAQKMASESGDGIGVKSQTLTKRLHERGLLTTTDTSRKRLTIRVTASAARQNVLHLGAGVLSETPSQTSQTNRNGEG